MADSEWKDVLSSSEGKITEDKEGIDTETCNNRGVSYLNNRQFDKAIKEFNKAVKFNDQYAPGYFNLGVCYEALERYDDALVNYEKAYNLDKSQPISKMRMDVIYHRKAVKSNPRNVDAYLRLGGVLKALNELDEAISAFEEAIKLKPDMLYPYLGLGMSFHSKGWYDKALEIYKIALQKDPSFADVYGNMGVTYFELAKYDEGIEVCKKALELDPRNPVFHFNLGSCYEGKGMIAQAKDEYKRALELDPLFDAAKNALSAM
ncbi:MAG: TPR repeat-containing protein YrrB [Elusimicrobia bacterium ADurb.Bin231]|nr:MAG: TPR repeat-containing protein YrrB [Elusimicrobia bacterium ADurb.Bin231]